MANLLSKYFADLADEEAWRGAGCRERDEQGVRDVLRRRIWNRWKYEAGILRDVEWAIINDALEPSRPDDIKAWKPGLRLRQAEEAFLVLMGLEGMIASHKPGHWISIWAARVLKRTFADNTVRHLQKTERWWIANIGKHWLKRMCR